MTDSAWTLGPFGLSLRIDKPNDTNALLHGYRRARQIQDRIARVGPSPTRIQDAGSWTAFDQRPADEQDAAWKQLACEAKRKTDGTAIVEGVIDVPLDLPLKPVRTCPPRPLDPSWQLDDIPADQYIPALTGGEVPIGRMSCCPLPDHDDETPSFKAYPNGSWTCWGCGRAGTIFQFAAALWGYCTPLRGDDFRDVRDRLMDELGVVNV